MSIPGPRSADKLLIIGAPVDCLDGPAGVLTRVVIDPLARAVTHLALNQSRPNAVGRLVPIDLLTDAPQISDGLELRCSTALLDGLKPSGRRHFLPTAGRRLGYAEAPVHSRRGFAHAGPGGKVAVTAAPSQASASSYIVDVIPDGAVQVRRWDRVCGPDGLIGVVRGLTVDRTSHSVTHVLLDEGHLWGQKHIAIPIGVVTTFANGIRLSLTQEQARALPSITLDAPPDDVPSNPQGEAGG